MSDAGTTRLLRVARAFEPGARARDLQLGDATFWTRSIGELIAPTGRIVACDPFDCVDAPAFARQVPSGRYPVLLAVAQFARNGDERIAAAMLRLREAEPVRWEPAVWTRDGANAGSETDEERGKTDGDPAADAYCVDSGLGAFMDEAAIEALVDHIEAEDDEDYLEGRLDASARLVGPRGLTSHWTRRQGPTCSSLPPAGETANFPPTGATPRTEVSSAFSRTSVSLATSFSYWQTSAVQASGSRHGDHMLDRV